jgi:hypothetical protein
VNGRTAGSLTWYVNDIPGGSQAVGTISPFGLYSAPDLSVPTTFIISAATSPAGPRSAGTVVIVLRSGQVLATQHPLVVKYHFLALPGSSALIEFGTDMSYRRRTWMQSADANGEIDILVAGMRARTSYHMRAQITFPDGLAFQDSDHTFVSGDIPEDRLPTITTRSVSGKTPQGGVELIDLASSSRPQGILALVTDLDGTVIWYYDAGPVVPVPSLDPIKLLPNGHFLLVFTDITPGSADGQNSVIQEVDLSGQVVWQMSYTDLNQLLAQATCAQCNRTVIGAHHDFALLPNGHIVLLAAESRYFTSLDGYPNGTEVVGDLLIDLDENRKPVWVWSAFDHLDPNRHLMGLPDWTHSNTVVYSPDDQNLMLSIRNQSWVIKIDYRAGQGSGDILWKLGNQGDFTLLNGSDPVDWQYAQHDINVISSGSAGSFEALVFDNGNLRALDGAGNTCGSNEPCYSRVVTYQVDESARTVSLAWVNTLDLFSFFGGSARLLANGNVEFDECAGPLPGPNSAIFEATRSTPPQTVWQMTVSEYAYRAFRMPSLYPGVQW